MEPRLLLGLAAKADSSASTGMSHLNMARRFREMISPGLKQPWAETVLARRRVELE
ncbi:MAG: hypothetical protein ABR594_00515 [Pyrinomonadaceae bacterium]